MKDFFKNKFNLIYTILQAIAILFLCLSTLSGLFLILCIIVEGIFFIVLGVSYFVKIKEKEQKDDLYSQLPFAEERKEKTLKKNTRNRRFNKLTGVFYILIGVALIFMIIF